MPLLEFGAWLPDTVDYESTTSHVVQNVIPRADGYGPFPSFTSVSQALPAACRGAFYALKSDGTVITFAGTATKLYKLNNTDYSWTDVSVGGGSYSSLTASAQWQFAQTGNLVFATQANAVLQVFDLSSSAAFANALGSPPQAAYISVIGRFLVLSGLLSNPYRVQWSGLNNFNASTSWDNLTAGSNFQDLPDGGIVRGVAGGDQSGVICQDQAFRAMAYVAGAPYTFQIERIAQGVGLYAPYSIVRAGSSTLFYTTQGFYKMDPGGVPMPIGREKVDRTFALDFDNSNLQLMIGASDPRTTRVYWSYKSTSGAAQANLYDKILGYDTVLDRFFTILMYGEYLLGISQTGLTLENLDAISASIDAMTLSLDAYPTAVQPEIAQFGSLHKMGFFRGPYLEATLESGEQGTDENKITIRGFRPVTDAPTLYGSVSYRENLLANATAGAEVLINARTGRCDMRRDTRYSRFKVRIPAGTSWSFCSGVVPDLVQGGKL